MFGDKIVFYMEMQSIIGFGFAHEYSDSGGPKSWQILWTYQGKAILSLFRLWITRHTPRLILYLPNDLGSSDNYDPTFKGIANGYLNDLQELTTKLRLFRNLVNFVIPYKSVEIEISVFFSYSKSISFSVLSSK